MTDVHDPQTRSYNMSRIKGKDTKPEMVVRRFLFAGNERFTEKCGFLVRIMEKAKSDASFNRHLTSFYYRIQPVLCKWLVNKRRTFDRLGCPFGCTAIRYHLLSMVNIMGSFYRNMVGFIKISFLCHSSLKRI